MLECTDTKGREEKEDKRRETTAVTDTQITHLNPLLCLPLCLSVPLSEYRYLCEVLQGITVSPAMTRVGKTGA